MKKFDLLKVLIEIRKRSARRFQCDTRFIEVLLYRTHSKWCAESRVIGDLEGLTFKTSHSVSGPEAALLGLLGLLVMLAT